MPNLATTYLSLNLKNPVIAASSGFTRSVEKLKEMEQAGVGAVVLKSLFEEVLASEDWGTDVTFRDHTEAYDYHLANLEMIYGPKDYCDFIKKAKAELSIPVIASINCVSAKWWPDFAEQLEAAGADALELNVFTTATDPKVTGEALENLYFDILKQVKAKIKIPVAMKIGKYFTALPNFASQLDTRGADGLVLFNRFTEPDIDIDKLEPKTSFTFSHDREYHLPLRWIALISGAVKCDLSATTGIHDAETAVKMILAGASTVQIASVLYQKGPGEVKTILSGIESWMEKHKFSSVDEFKGKVSFASTDNPDQYLRTQFIEKISHTE